MMVEQLDEAVKLLHPPLTQGGGARRHSSEQQGGCAGEFLPRGGRHPDGCEPGGTSDGVLREGACDSSQRTHPRPDKTGSGLVCPAKMRPPGALSISSTKRRSRLSYWSSAGCPLHPLVPRRLSSRERARLAAKP